MHTRETTRSVTIDGELDSETCRTETVYRFLELSPEAQDAAIESYREGTYTSLEAYDLRDDDYWQDKAAESGFSIDSRSYATHGGGTGSELAVYWDCYPWYVYFTAMVNVRDFLLSRKLGRRYALLLANMETETVGIGRTDSRRPVAQGDIDIPEEGYIPRYYSEVSGRWEYVRLPQTREEKRYVRLEAQEREVDTLIREEYDTLAKWIADSLQSNEEYLTGEERARDHLTDENEETWFREDGTRA